MSCVNCKGCCSPFPRKVSPTSIVVISYVDSKRSDVEEVTMDHTVYTMLPKTRVMKTSFSPKKVKGARTVLQFTLAFFLGGTAFSWVSLCPVM